MQRRVAGFLAGAALLVVSVVLAHELVYLARYGSLYNEALVHTGHGEAWSSAVTASLILTLGLLVAGVARLAWLGALVRRGTTNATDSIRKGDLDVRALLRGFLRTAPRLVVLAVVFLSLQENVERASVGQALPGPLVLLTPEYAGGLWITIGVGLAVAFVAALFDWRRRALLARLRAARVAIPRHHASQPRRPAVVVRPQQSLLGRRSALRAPPAPAAT
jgi:hypothetical protein